MLQLLEYGAGHRRRYETPHFDEDTSYEYNDGNSHIIVNESNFQRHMRLARLRYMQQNGATTARIRTQSRPQSRQYNEGALTARPSSSAMFEQPRLYSRSNKLPSLQPHSLNSSSSLSSNTIPSTPFIPPSLSHITKPGRHDMFSDGTYLLNDEKNEWNQIRWLKPGKWPSTEKAGNRITQEQTSNEIMAVIEFVFKGH